MILFEGAQIEKVVYGLLLFLFSVVQAADNPKAATPLSKGNQLAWSLTNKSNTPRVASEAGFLTIDWKELLAHLHIISPSTLVGGSVSLLINGNEVAVAKEEQISLRVPDCPRGQCDYYLLFRDAAGQVRHRTEPIIRENQSVQNIPAFAFEQLAVSHSLKFSLPPSMLAKGLSGKLTEKGVELGYQKMVWVLSPKAEVSVRKLIEATPGIQVVPTLDSKGKPRSVKLLLEHKILAKDLNPDNFFFKVDASFNGNCFFWDDMFVALATVPYYPAMAKSTVEFWLEIQNANGGVIPREVRKVNLKSLWFPDVIRIDRPALPNLQYTNPYLLHRVALELYRFDPSDENRELLKKCADSIIRYANWIEEQRGVRDSKGHLIGFTTSSLGSGGDDSRGERGNEQSLESLEAGWVDLLAQQLDLHRSLVVIYSILDKSVGQKEFRDRITQQKKKIRSLSQLLQQRYWDPQRTFYFDLVKRNGSFVRDTTYESIFAFWPLLSGSVDRTKTNLLAKNYLIPTKFGGSFPLPANARDKIVSLDDNEDGYWNKWSHWPSTAAMVITGFAESGRPDVAYRLAFDFVRGMEEASTETVFEFYGEQPGDFKARPGRHFPHKTRADFAGWGKVPPIFNMLRHVVGIEPLANGRLAWNLLAPLEKDESLSVQNLNYRGAVIANLQITKISEAKYQVSAQSPIAIDIEIRKNRQTSRLRLGGDSASKSIVTLRATK